MPTKSNPSKKEAEGSDNPRDARSSEYALRVNSYDRASSVLISLLIMVGATFVGLVIIFFTSSVISVQTAIPVTPVDAAPAAQGLANDSSPGVENAPEELELELQETLNIMDGLVAAQLALFDADSNPNASAPKGDGLGDSRATGEGYGTGRDEPQREIRFEPDSLEEYAVWFDKTGMELGVLGSDNQVYYAKGLSTADPVVRVGAPEEETRLYFNSTGGPLGPLDRQLARKAGISNRGAIVLQFCSAETAQILLGLEQQSAQGKTTEQIRRTVFRVERRGTEYGFKVEEILFR